jgi:hypothetical protein
MNSREERNNGYGAGYDDNDNDIAENDEQNGDSDNNESDVEQR